MSLPVAVALWAVLAAAPDAPALGDAAGAGSEGRVRELLEAGAPVDGTGEHDWTGLHRAVIGGHADVAALLLERGADPNARGQFDLTPLHWAALTGRADLVHLLVKRGARMDARDLWGRAPVHEAADGKVVRALVELGGEVNLQDRRGLTPLHLARNEGVANVLLELRADLRIRTRTGLTALELNLAEASRAGLIITTGKIAGRLRGERAEMEVLLRNLSPRPIASLSATFSGKACTATPAVPEFSLAPGELVTLPVALVRTPDVPEGPHPLTAVFRAEGQEVGTFELTVDTSRGVTPEDQGLIKLASGSLRGAPSDWANVAFVAGPLLLLAIWFAARRLQRRE